MGALIKYSKSFIDFLKTKKESSVIARLLYHAYQKDADGSEHIKSYELMITDEQINYLTFRNNGNISFLPAGKEHLVNDNGTWKMENRQEGRPGKVIRKLFTDKALKIIPAKEFEQFTNQYKAEFNEEGYTFAILPNTRINEVYNNTNRKEGGASLNSSCMNRDSAHRQSDVDGIFLEMYAMCDNLQIITLTTRSGQLCGRALLWTLDGGIKLMDRIYVSDDFMYDMFINYASENCMWRKESYKSFDFPRKFVNEHGETVYQSFMVKTDTDFKKYPYIDTFRWGGDGWLSNDEDIDHEYTYHNTGGTRDCDDSSSDDDDDDDDDDESECYDEINDDYCDRGDLIQVERGRYRGHWTHYRSTVEVGGHTWWRDDEGICYLSWSGEWYEREDVVYSERDCEDYPLDECVHCNYIDDYILRDDAIKIDDDWFHKEDCVQTHDGRNILKDEMIEQDGLIYHQDDDEVQPDYSAPIPELCNKLAKFEKPNINQLTFVELCEND